MAEAMKSTTKSMVRMGKAIKMPQLQKIVRDFAVQSERMEMTGEVMSDAIDMAMEGSDDEEEEEEMLKSVEAELGLSLMDGAPAVGAGAAVGTKAPSAAVAAPVGAGGAGGTPPGGPKPPGGGDSGGGGAASGGAGGGSGGGGVSDLEARLANLRS